MRVIFSIFLLGVVPLFVSMEARAESDLSLEQAIIKVLQDNPDLKAADFASRAATERVRTARLSTPFNAGLDVENIGGNGNRDSVDAIETTLSLSRVLETGNKAGLRGELAQQSASLTRNEQDIRRIDLIAQTANAYVEVVKQQELGNINTASLALAKRIMATAERRSNAGRSPKAEYRRAKIGFARAELVAAQSVHRLNSSRVKLSSLWGQTEPGFNRAKGELLEVEPVKAFAEYESRLDESPELVRFATQKRLAEARLHLASAQRKPNVELQAGLRHFQESDDVGLVLSASLPLASARRASARIEEARLLNEGEPYRYEQQRLALTATLYELHQQLQHAYKSVIRLREEIVPLAKQALVDYGKGYAAGRYSFLEVRVAQQDLLDARYDLVKASVLYHRYRIEIDRLTGLKRSTGVAQ